MIYCAAPVLTINKVLISYHNTLKSLKIILKKYISHQTGIRLKEMVMSFAEHVLHFMCVQGTHPEGFSQVM